VAVVALGVLNNIVLAKEWPRKAGHLIEDSDKSGPSLPEAGPKLIVAMMLGMSARNQDTHTIEGQQQNA
jgi:hypothetical protein